MHRLCQLHPFVCVCVCSSCILMRRLTEWINGNETQNPNAGKLSVDILCCMYGSNKWLKISFCALHICAHEAPCKCCLSARSRNLMPFRSHSIRLKRPRAVYFRLKCFWVAWANFYLLYGIFSCAKCQFCSNSQFSSSHKHFCFPLKKQFHSQCTAICQWVQQRNVMHNEEFLGFTTESRKIAFISN